MKGYDIIEALGQAEEMFVEEAEQGRRRHIWQYALKIVAACLVLLLIPTATVLATDYFSSIKGDELAFERVEYLGDGVVAIQVHNYSEKTLEFQEDVKLCIFYANQEIPQIDGGKVEMEGNVVAPHSTSELRVDLSGAYDMGIAEKPLEDDWYYLVLTNNHFVFGQDWQCTVDFQNAIEERTVYGAQTEDAPPERRELETDAFVYEDWAAPVDKLTISGCFGPQGNNRVSDHINIAGNKGDSVFAVEDGTVVEIGFNAEDGNYIVLMLADDMKVKYGHLNDVLVSENQEVEKGEAVGTVGQTGMATGPNLSLTLFVNGEAVNPLKEDIFE